MIRSIELAVWKIGQVVHFKDFFPLVDDQGRPESAAQPEGAWFSDGPVRAGLVVMDKHPSFGESSVKNQGVGDNGRCHAARLAVRVIELTQEGGNIAA